MLDLQLSIPSSWEIVPLKVVASQIRRGLTPNYVDHSPIRVVGQTAVRHGRVSWEQARPHGQAYSPLDSEKGSLLLGDVLVNSTGTGTLGRVAYCESLPRGSFYVADSHVTVVRPNPERVLPRFLYYWLESAPLQGLLSSMVVGSTNQIELSRDRFAVAPVALPSLEEQRAIADYLDVGCGRMDDIARKSRSLQTVSDERVDSSIMNLVGRSRLTGADGFKCVPIRRVLRKLNRKTKDTAEVVTAFRDGQVTARSLRRLDGYTVSSSTAPQGQGVEVGDVVVHGLDGFSGAIGDAEAAGNCSPVNHVCLPVDGGDPAFYGRLLRLLALDGYLELFATSTRERAVDFRNWEKFAGIPVPEIPITRQREIGVDILSGRIAKTRIEDFCKLIGERRNSLIAAAVTGRIDVTTARGVDV